MKERFALVDEVDSLDLWGEARRRAEAAEVRPVSDTRWSPGWRRLGTGVVAFAVFAAAVVFSWNLSHPDPGPVPRPAPAVDLGSELPVGWSELPPPPANRSGAATAWTGSELLVWGGYEFVGSGDEEPDGDGFVFDAATRTWEPMPGSPLDGRMDTAFAWTGDELLIWGGWDGAFRGDPYRANGAAYDPSAGTWRMLPPAPITGRRPFSVWTGEELLVWGSADRDQRLRDGAAYDPVTDTWRAIPDGPIDITDGSAVWTGDEMIVFGAALDHNNHADTPTAVGAAYDPVADTWRRLPASDLSPQAMTAAWLGDEMVAWDYDQASAAYDPVTDTWRSLADVPLAFSECRPVSVATPRVLFGDFCGKTVVLSSKEEAWHRIPLDLRDPPGGCCWVLQPIAVGDVVFVPAHLYSDLGLLERHLFVYNPPTDARTDTRGEVLDPEPFLPATERDGDHLRMPVVFPDGTRAVLVFPNELGLDESSVQPDVSYIWQDDPPPRYPIVFLHDPYASIRTYVDGAEPLATIHSREIWAMSDEWESHRNQLHGVWLRLRLDSWTVLVASTTVEDAVAVADYLHVVETRTGFPVVEAVGPVALATGFGEAEGPQLAFGDATPEPDRVSQLDAAIFLSPDGCMAGSEVSAGYGSACLGEGSVFASIYGDRDFVASVVDRLRVEDFRQM